jgi:arylsulfatase A-like enzyme
MEDAVSQLWHRAFTDAHLTHIHNYSAEYLKENGEEGHWPEFYGGLTRDGRKIRVGNLKELQPGGEDTFMSYDLPWANASNAPFRLFKSWVHEGGIATPFIVHWPAATTSMLSNDIHHCPWVIMDIVATCCVLAGVPVPGTLEGESFIPILTGKHFLCQSLQRCSIAYSYSYIKVKPLSANNQYFGSIKEIAQ